MFDGSVFDGSAVRRGVPIIGYVGANGDGKTLAMVRDTEQSLRTGRAVLSTKPLFEVVLRGGCPEDDGRGAWMAYAPAPGIAGWRRPHPLYVPLVSWGQVVAAANCDMLLDEITGVASSRSYQGTPQQLVNKLVKLRHDDVVARWTAPNWMRADVVLREVSQAVCVCKGYVKKAVPGLLWPQKSVFQFATYDAMAWEDYSLNKVEKVRCLSKEWYFRSRGMAMHMYDTLGSVDMLDHTDQGGHCLTCGGKRALRKCDCPDETGERDGRGRRRGAGTAVAPGTTGDGAAL